MTLSAGTKLGSYEILAPIGAGGMGEVYRARDTRLERDVAVKVLPEHLFENRERGARFEREAKALAAVNHPAIASIHSFEEVSGRHLLVMELLEGDTLRTRLAGGPLVPRRALEVAIPIALGLAAAHDKGIVHRDLKPENVFLTKDGRVKILDFGLAKLEERPPRSPETTGASTHSAATEPGVVLGTMGYMSPEQVRGGALDARSDLFSFGAVLYEVLSGQRAFRGSSPADTLSAILREDPPDFSEAGVTVPAPFERLVRHCLEKSPENRFQSARDLAFALEAIPLDAGTSSSSIGGGATRPIGALMPSRLLRPASAALALAALLAAAAATWVYGRRPAAPEIRFAQASYGRGTISSARFGADGRSLVYVATWNGMPSRLFLKASDAPDGTTLDFPRAELLAISSEGEMAVLLDPQPGHVGLFTGTLARAPVTGGAPREIAAGVSGADWSPDGTKLLAVREEDGRSILEYPLGKLLYATSGHISHPRISPRGDRIAFFDHPLPLDDRGSVAVLDLSGNKKTLTGQFGSLQGLAWGPGGDEVWFTGAERVSIRALRGVSLAGVMRPILPGVGRLRLLDVSKEGTVLLARDAARMTVLGRRAGEAQERDLTWFDLSFARDISADGKTLLCESGAEPAGALYAVGVRGMDGSPVVRLGDGYANALSPDGAWVLASLPASDSPIDLLPTGKGVARKIPISLAERGVPVFSPDGKRILFTAREPGHQRRVYAVSLEGGTPVPVSLEADMVRAMAPGCISPDGRFAAVERARVGVLLLPLDGGEVRPLPGARANDVPLRWSADGRAVFVRAGARVPAAIFLLDVATGRRAPFRELVPADPAGVEAIEGVVLSSDGAAYAYNASRVLSEMYLVTGVR